MRLRPTQLFVLVIGLTALSGCGRIARTKQCRALISRINDSVTEIQSMTGDKHSGPAYASAAQRYEKLANDLGPLEFSSEQMARDVAEYSGVLRETAKILRGASSAMAQTKIADVENARRELERVAHREKYSISKMEAWCHNR